MNKYTYQNNKECEFFSQYPKAKKSKINENIFQDISYLELNTNLIKNQTENLLLESFNNLELLNKKNQIQHIPMLYLGQQFQFFLILFI